MSIAQSDLKVKRALRTFFKLTVAEIIILLTVTPEFLSFIPILERFFASINSIFVPTFSESDNFIQKIIGWVVGLVQSLDFLCVIIELALYLIPISFIITLLFVLPIHKLLKALKINKIKKQRTEEQKPVRKFSRIGFSDNVSFIKSIMLKRALQKLQDETVFSLTPNNESCIRVQKMSVSDSNVFTDTVLNWNVNGKALYSDTAEGITLNMYISDGTAFLCVGENEYPLTINAPFKLDKSLEEGEEAQISYIITWIGSAL